jgi:membrane associated rhomboid family serine protease
MDLNHIFLFVALISSLLVLARAWRPGGTYRGWRIAALVVLAVTATAWLVFRKEAGYVGGGAWFAFLFLPAVGLRKASDLAAQRRYKSARRLATLLQVLHPTAQLREQIELFRALESRHIGPLPAPPALQDRHRRLKGAPAVLILICLNLAVFLFELTRGDLNAPETLHQLGALDPYAVALNREYWRLFTALFLHYGAVHLLFNLFALYVLGPALERLIGSLRFVACYLLSGLGSTAGVVGLTIFGFIQPAELVGASGSVMGIVGAWAGFLLQHRYDPRAKERLLNILLIVAIQIVFDISTPQVSMSAHICGLLTGFFVGLVIAPRKVSI